MTSIPTPAASPAPHAWWAAVIALCLALVAPLAMVEVPPLLDYPNHLARLTVLTFGSGDEFLSRFYASRWRIQPDLGIDVIGVGLLRLMPPLIAGRVILGIIVVLPVLGAIMLSSALFGRRSWWTLGCGLVVFNLTLLLGFMNFTAATGLAMMLAAVWIRGRESDPTRTGLLVGFGAVGVFLCHVMGPVFLGILIGSYEAEWLWQSGVRDRAPPIVLLRRIGIFVSVFVVPIGLYLLTPLQSEPLDFQYGPLNQKLTDLLVPVTNYIWSLDVLTAAIIGLAVAALIVSRCCQFSVPGGIALLVTIVAFTVAPAAAKGAFHFDARFMALAGFLLFVVLRPVDQTDTSKLVLTVVMVVLFVIRMFVLSQSWSDYERSVLALRETVKDIPAGSTVYFATIGEDLPTGNAAILSTGKHTDTHLPAVLVIERRSWWPFLFDNETQQPVETRMPYREIARRIGAVPEIKAPSDVRKTDLSAFDFVLLQIRGPVTGFPSERDYGLELAAMSGEWVLLRKIEVPEPKPGAESGK